MYGPGSPDIVSSSAMAVSSPADVESSASSAVSSSEPPGVVASSSPSLFPAGAGEHANGANVTKAATAKFVKGVPGHRGSSCRYTNHEA